MFKFADHGCYLFPYDFRASIRLSLSPWRWGTACNAETLMFMACLAKVVRAPIVEFGTFTGLCTYNMALNTDQKIYTIDYGCDVDPSNSQKYGYYIPGDEFRKTEVEDRIELIIGDSREVDLSHLNGTIGLVFIDGGHSREVVTSDTRKAFDLIRTDGMIVWDDCSEDWPEVGEALRAILDEHTERMDRLLLVEKDCQALYWGPATVRIGSKQLLEAA
jgi:predicted O-methyltransferase YrrM